MSDTKNKLREDIETVKAYTNAAMEADGMTCAVFVAINQICAALRDVLDAADQPAYASLSDISYVDAELDERGFHSEGQCRLALRRAASSLRALAAPAFVPYTDAELREWYPVMCNHCGWRGLSRDCTGGGPIADTGDFNEITCPQCWADSDGKAVDPREVVVIDGKQPAEDVADIRTALGFIFGRFCRPEDARELPDDVVAAVRRLESAVGPDTIVQRAKRHALYRAENKSVEQEGFMLVPIEPTAEMVKAFLSEFYKKEKTFDTAACYRAMLAASQTTSGEQP